MRQPTKHELTFFRKYLDLQNSLSLHDNYELAKIAGILRHMLLDGNPLIHKANKNFRTIIWFRYNEINKPPANCISLIVADGFYPPTASPSKSKKSRRKKLDKFIKARIAFESNREILVRDLIKGLCHAGGVIHSGKPESEVEAIVAKSADFSPKNNFTNMYIYTLKAVAKVVLKATEQLFNEIVQLIESS